jgi:hypothetical protein
MNKRYPTVPQISGAHPRFKYSAQWSECRIIHEHNCMGTRLLIVGDPDCGGYEWVILTSGKVESHSNDGYGISEVALRDGLIKAFKDCFGPPITPATAECQGTSPAPAACPPSQAAGYPACAAEMPVVVEADEELHSLHKQVLHALFAGAPNGSLEGWDESATDSTSCESKAPPLHQSQASPAQAAALACHSPCGSSTPPEPEERSRSQPKLSSSSADPTDACGDINCDGQCQIASPKPGLIHRIDHCTSEEAARLAVADATPAALRNAARYLRTDLHSLPSAITLRVRERLLKAA